MRAQWPHKENSLIEESWDSYLVIFVLMSASSVLINAMLSSADLLKSMLTALPRPTFYLSI